MTDMSQPLSGEELRSVFCFASVLLPDGGFADLLLPPPDDTPELVLLPLLDRVEESLSDFETLCVDFVELADESVGVSFAVNTLFPAFVVLLLFDSDTHFRYSISALSVLYHLAFFGSCC